MQRGRGLETGQNRARGGMAALPRGILRRREGRPPVRLFIWPGGRCFGRIVPQPDTTRVWRTV